MKREKYALQFDASTDVPGFAQLIVLVWYITNRKLEEELLRCMAISGTCTGEDILSSGDETTELWFIMEAVY